MILEHVNLTVSDLQRSIDFYCRLLDLQVRWRTEPTEEEQQAHIGDERMYLALFQAPQPGLAVIDYDRVGINHFGFVVEDLVACRRRLAELQITPHYEAEYEPGRRLYFYDPDGIEVELVEYPAPGGLGETA